MHDATRKHAHAATARKAKHAHPSTHPGCLQPASTPRRFEGHVAAARADAILAACRKWVNGTRITYYCFKRGDGVPAAWQGSPADASAVDDAFETWARLGIGIGFRRVDTADDAMVRIGFDPREGSWCHVGRDVLDVRDPHERTTNFSSPLTTAQGQDTALHGIGHLLGLEHEHQHPNAGIAWNRAAVREHFRAEPNAWSDAQIEWNVLRQIPLAEAKGSAWDPDSVMACEFGPGLIESPAKYKDGLQPRGGLSYADKAWVVDCYPGVRAPAPATLKVGLSQLLKLKTGETRTFDFTPTRTRSYSFGTFGTSDVVIVLFEATPDGNVQIAGDDDSGTDRNARIRMRLNSGRHYQLGVRLYCADAPLETSLMAW